MKRLISITIMLWCSLAYGAAISSVGTGDWSAGATWSSGHVPAATDTVTIVAGHTVTMDEDTNDLGGLTIASTAILTADGSNITLTCSGDIVLTGTWNLGTSETPYAGIFIVDFDGTANNIEGGTGGVLNWYCDQPTYKTIKLSAQEAASQTVLSVDTNVTGDIWAAGDTIWICDISGTLPEAEERVIDAGGIAASTITVTAGLTATKETGAYVVLATRNI